MDMSNQKKFNHKLYKLTILWSLILFVVCQSCSSFNKNPRNINLLVKIPKGEIEYTHVQPIPSRRLVATVQKDDFEFEGNFYINTKIKISRISSVDSNHEVILGDPIKEIEVTIPNYVKQNLALNHRYPLMQLSPDEKWLMVFQIEEIQFWNTGTLKLQYIAKTRFIFSKDEKNIKPFTEKGKLLWFSNRRIVFTQDENIVAFKGDNGHILLYHLKQKRMYEFIHKNRLSGYSKSSLMDLSQDGKLLVFLEKDLSKDEAYISFVGTDSIKQNPFKKILLIDDEENFSTSRIINIGLSHDDEKLYLVSNSDVKDNFIHTSEIDIENILSAHESLDFSRPRRSTNIKGTVLHSIKQGLYPFYLLVYDEDTFELKLISSDGIYSSTVQTRKEMPLFSLEHNHYYLSPVNHELFYTDFAKIYMKSF